jgi:hypothetical protein
MKTPQELLEEARFRKGKDEEDLKFIERRLIVQSGFSPAQTRPKLVLEANYTLAIGEVKITLTRQELAQLRDSINSLLSG